MVAINYDIPEDLHRAFKALAARKGVTVKALLLELMEAAVKETEALEVRDG